MGTKKDVVFINKKLHLFIDTNKLERVRDSLDSYIDRINIAGSYENEKFYKIGFSDAINLILECVRINKI